MSDYGRFYEEAARAIAFESPARIFHRHAGRKPIESRTTEYDEQWIEAAEEAVWPLLYRWHYLRDRRRSPDRRDRLTMREREDPEFVARLTEANRSPGVLDPGWRVIVGGPDEYLCEKGGLQLRVSAASLEAAEARPDTGTVTIRFPAERRHSMPLYYCTGGGIATEVNLRVYFNIKPACAPWLLRILSHELLQAGVSYQLKLLNHPESYTRPDAAVLYAPLSAVSACRSIVDQFIAAGSSAFRGAVPALTRRIYPGIAVADEPPPSRGRQVSFGEHRCRILARGMARSHAGGARSLTQAVDAICRELTLENIDPAHPYASAAGQSASAAF